MREIRQSGSEGGAMQTNVSFLPLSTFYETVNIAEILEAAHRLRGFPGQIEKDIHIGSLDPSFSLAMDM